MKDLYIESYKTLVKEIEEDILERYFVIIDWKKSVLKCSYY